MIHEHTKVAYTLVPPHKNATRVLLSLTIQISSLLILFLPFLLTAPLPLQPLSLPPPPLSPYLSIELTSAVVVHLLSPLSQPSLSPLLHHRRPSSVLDGDSDIDKPSSSPFSSLSSLLSSLFTRRRIPLPLQSL